jgi:tRNA pseudouridine32 synthase/23S rRNA pseudouridine746 synthase
MLHHFFHSIEGIELPAQFTYPFHYTPHPLSVIAAGEVQDYLTSHYDFSPETHKGKMFGVLVVRTPDGSLGYLAAFSGLLDGAAVHPYFVPPVYDLTRPDGYFRIEESHISDINLRVAAIKDSDAYRTAKCRAESVRREAAEAIEAARRTMRQAKEERDRRRHQSLTDDEREAMVRESQYLKAETKRVERHWGQQCAEAEAALRELDESIASLKEERRQRSAALQDWLFRQFVMLNGRGESVALPELFVDTPQGTPPAGAGECAAPKLLQYAYLNNLQPIAMAEFWWGASPKNEVRIDREYYPACQGKCGPILRFMLQGLDVEPNPLDEIHTAPRGEVEILYEDRWLMVVCKPHDMLSVPGRESSRSLIDSLRSHLSGASDCPCCSSDAELQDGYVSELQGGHQHGNSDKAVEPLIVHRLDMATSGLLIVAKDPATHASLQRQFEQRTVSKRYKAILEGTGLPAEGTISLPLAADYLNRPRQLVDHVAGKEAVTHYRVIRETEDGRTHIYFYPKTGRTHQLRLHAAHADGLNAPIVGDTLYGRPSDRLYLHAESITFVHPATGEEMTIVREADF